ncbi:MAG: trypsin-like peptidase domain-containing protein [Ktedonobacteraceae bacterium]
MSVDFTKGIIRILGSDNESTVGTGFVVSSEGYIATCAHVVEAAEVERGGKVSFFWHATKQQGHAIVELEYWRDSDAQDIAILHVAEEKLPEGVISLPLGSSFNTQGQTLTSFGFPESKPVDGLWGESKILGTGAEGNIPILQGSSFQVSKGFSGAPLWDDSREAVVGMVSSIIGYKSIKIKDAALRVPSDPDGRQTETAFFTPVELLQEACPLLKFSLECPYRGLEIFTEDQKHVKYFFGREAFVERMLDRLKQQNTRFLSVLGPSGSGKSSVVRAGLVTKLKQGKIDDSAQWSIIIIRPLDDPFKQLAEKGLAIEPENPTKAIQAWFAQYPEAKRLVLVIDQFEELLSMCTDDVCKSFASTLRHILGSPFPITIIAVMRNDFYLQFVQQDILVDWLEQSQVNIPLSLSREDVTTIVQTPAIKAGLRFERGLVETIVVDATEAIPLSTNEQYGASSTILPLLEFALTELWNRRKNGELTRKDYEEIRGVKGGLTRWADDAFFSPELANPEKQRKARRILTDLVYVGYKDLGLHNSRLRIPIASLYHNAYEIEEVNWIVHHLTNHHLLITDFDPVSKQETVEIIHDVLITQWQQLKSWLTQDRDFLAWRQEFEKDVRSWMQANRPAYKLVRGEDLTQALQWLNEHPSELTPEQRNFIRISQEQQERLEQGERVLKQNEITLSNDQRLTRRTFLGGAIGGIISLSVSFDSIKWWESTQNLHLFSPHGVSIFTYLGHESAGPVLGIAWSPDSRRIASSDSNRQIDMCDANDGMHVLQCLPSPKGAVGSVAWSPNGNYLASGSDDKTLQIWDTMGNLVQTYQNHRDDVHSVKWSPDGRYIATGCNDCRAYIWDATKKWDLTKKYPPLRICSHGASVWQVAWSPNGKYIASTCSDNTVQVWEASTAQRQFTYEEHTDEVYAVAWSPDGQYIASAGRDSKVRVWSFFYSDSISLGDTVNVYEGHTAIVDSITWSPDGQYIASGGGHDNNSSSGPEDHTVQVWNALGGGDALYYEGHTDRVHCVAWSPDGTRIASGGYDRTVQIWKMM